MLSTSGEIVFQNTGHFAQKLFIHRTMNLMDDAGFFENYPLNYRILMEKSRTAIFQLKITKLQILSLSVMHRRNTGIIYSAWTAAAAAVCVLVYSACQTI